MGKHNPDLEEGFESINGHLETSNYVSVNNETESENKIDKLISSMLDKLEYKKHKGSGWV